MALFRWLWVVATIVAECSSSVSENLSHHQRLLAALERGQYHLLNTSTNISKSIPLYMNSQRGHLDRSQRSFTPPSTSQQVNQYRTISSNRASPRARLEHAVAPLSYGAVLFGGRRNDNNADITSFNDTWIFLAEGELWQRQDFSVDEPTPASRFGHSLATTTTPGDDTTPILYMFGGRDANTYLDDMWHLTVTNFSDENANPTSWGRVRAPSGGGIDWPSARAQHGVAVDLSSGDMYVYGGDVSDSVVSNELWRWNHQDWNKVTNGSQGPDLGLAEHSMVSVGTHLLVYGGRTTNAISENMDLSSDTWIFSIDDGTWEKLTVQGDSPGARLSHSAVVFDSATSGLYEMHILFGEMAGRRYPDIVSYKLVYSPSEKSGTWYKVNQTDYNKAPFPILRGGQTVSKIPPVVAATGDAGPDRSIIFGGECRLAVNLGLPFRDAWSYTPSNDGVGGDSGPYLNLEVQDYPPTLMSHTATMVYGADNSGTQMCIFGGLNVHSGFSQDLWCLTMDTNGTTHGWRHKYTNQKQSQLPIKRADHTAVTLRVGSTGGREHRHLVMFGGRNHFAVAVDEKPLGDTWSYSFDAYEWHKVRDLNVIENVELNRMAHSAVVIDDETTTWNDFKHLSTQEQLQQPSYFKNSAGIQDFAIYGGVIYDSDGIDDMTSSIYRCFYSCEDSSKTNCSCNWKSVSAVNGIPPFARAWHSAVMLDNKMVVWGGRRTLNERLNLTNDLMWVSFENGRYSWEVKNPSSALPTPVARYAHACAKLSNTRMVIVGGFSNRGVESDVWIYDITMERWNQLFSPSSDDSFDSIGISKMPRGYHTISYNSEDGQMYLYGGTSLDLTDTDGDQEGIVFGFRSGCNGGTVSTNFSDKACSKCTSDTWAAAGDAVCSSCPAGTKGTDDDPSALMSSIMNCSVCVPDYCKGGACNVIVDTEPRAHCKCHPGFEGATCESLDAGAKVAIGCGVAFAIIMMAALYVRSKKFRKIAEWLKDDNTSKGLQIQQLIRNWQIDPAQIVYTEVIGDGAFGSVHKGMFNSMHVAVKKLKTHGLPPSYYQELCETFHTEASVLIRLRHKNIIHFFGAGYEETSDKSAGIPILVTELATRGSLQSVLLNRGIEISQLQKLSFALDAAEGMQYLHSEGVVHRDLKSPNLLVADSMTVKVADFGTGTFESKFANRKSSVFSRQSSIAQQSFFQDDFHVLTDDAAEKAKLIPNTAEQKRYSSVNAETSDAIDDPPSGTTEWMAPELHQAMENRKFGAKSKIPKPVFGREVDVYAFGIVLWEIAARKQPFYNIDPGPGGVNIRKLVIDGQRPPIPQAAPAYTVLMVNCWSTEITARPTFDSIVKSLTEHKQSITPSEVSNATDVADAVANPYEDEDTSSPA
eukprot:m.68527 g.68527  ORF g.68527 m.68527 type:complete len:1376 (+) comp23967_c1_seq1:169-4296(+)